MNRPFRALPLSSAVSAVAAVRSTLLIVAGIGGLAEHYDGKAQVAAVHVSAQSA